MSPFRGNLKSGASVLQAKHFLLCPRRTLLFYFSLAIVVKSRESKIFTSPAAALLIRRRPSKQMAAIWCVMAGRRRCFISPASAAAAAPRMRNVRDWQEGNQPEWDRFRVGTVSKHLGRSQPAVSWCEADYKWSGDAIFSLPGHQWNSIEARFWTHREQLSTSADVIPVK